MSVAIVLYDYDANEDDELSIKKYQQLEVLTKNEDDWWLVRRDNDVGLIPSNYVYISSQSSNNVEYNKNNDNVNDINCNGINNGWVSPDIRNTKKKTIESSPTSSGMNQSDFLRLKQLREDAEKKIDALREAVSSHENNNFKVINNNTSNINNANDNNNNNNKYNNENSKNINLRHRNINNKLTNINSNIDDNNNYNNMIENQSDISRERDNSQFDKKLIQNNSKVHSKFPNIIGKTSSS